MNEQRARQELEIDSSTSFEIIRRRYHELVRRYHPDKNPNNAESAEKCKRVIEAYSVLCKIKKQPKTQEELEMEQQIWNLFSEFWSVSKEVQSTKTKKDISLKLEHEQPYWQFVKEKGFYDFVSP